MKKLSFTFIMVLLLSNILFSQIAINEDGSAPDASAALDIYYTNKGFLPPRLTSTQRSAIPSPATGLLVFQTDTPSGYYFYTGTSWTYIGSGDGQSGNLIDIDGNIYTTVKIGNQEWMAKNLQVTHYRNGDIIPNITDNTEWSAYSLTTGAYCWYNNDPLTYAIYGILYNSYAVNDSRGLCPIGWHVPTDAEFITLTVYLGGNSVAGGKMKISTLWNSPNNGATNSSFLSGIPSGVRYFDGNFFSHGDFALWWTSTIDDVHAYAREISKWEASIWRGPLIRRYGCSVRCVKDY